MDYDSIFSAYYRLYRAESTVPTSADDEYTIGLSLANEAIHHWRTYDNTLWKELFVNLQASGEGVTVSTGTTQYDAPEDFARGGGFIKALDSDGKMVQKWPVIEPQDVQFKGDNDTYAYFSGNPVDGYLLNINPVPSSSLVGKSIDYWYYKKPTEFTQGSDITEMSDPYFIVHRMLTSRYRPSRNPYYDDAKKDAENALAKMKIDNDSGSWANPWTMPDRSGTTWGS